MLEALKQTKYNEQIRNFQRNDPEIQQFLSVDPLTCLIRDKYVYIYIIFVGSIKVFLHVPKKLFCKYHLLFFFSSIYFFSKTTVLVFLKPNIFKFKLFSDLFSFSFLFRQHSNSKFTLDSANYCQKQCLTLFPKVHFILTNF